MTILPRVRLTLSASILSLLLVQPALAQDSTALPVAIALPDAAALEASAWAFEETDLPLDPDFTFGRLPNGMRYIIRHNTRPEGTGMVQMLVDSGSLSEADSELGYAHFIEHMAFNGSTNIPEGEMIKLLEREGLAFGADTNASTNYDYTLYKLDLPRNDPALLDTALMLMRETASELTFDQAAIDREKGVILSEKRVRDGYALQNYIDNLDFLYPDARFENRLPIGTVETLNNASSDALKALWDRLYTPTNTTVIVVGDFDPAQVETMIASRFASWAAEPHPQEPDAGPVALDRQGLTDIFIDPALAEQVTISRSGPWLDEPDTVENRRKGVLRTIGYGIINRRFQSLARTQEAPFRSAGLGTSDAFEEARTTNLVVNSGDGEWQQGMEAAVLELRRALTFGFTEAEVAEQLANLRTVVENAVAGADTRSNASFVGMALSLVQDERIPTTPASGLERLTAMQDSITPQSVMDALKEELIPLDNPLIRFEGRSEPEGGADALRAAWDAANSAEIADTQQSDIGAWKYTDFGEPGQVVSDTVPNDLGIRTLRFANGVMLNLKPTDLEQDRIRISLHIDGGDMLDTKDDPLVTALVSRIPAGGIGDYSQDELQTVLAGRSVGYPIQPDEESFRSTVTTTPRDLELQLQLLAALVTRPAYRTEAEVQYRRQIENYFASRDATPDDALKNAQGGILSDNDPRFTLQDQEAYLARDFARLQADIAGRLEHGAIEIAMVGDFDPDLAIDLVARTFGALPAREAAFRPYDENRQRSFTADRSQRIIYHDGKEDQAILRIFWPTRDQSDLRDHLLLELLERVVRIELTDTLREELGQTYSPSVSAGQSRTYPGYGTFTISAAVDVATVDATRAAVRSTLEQLIAAPIDEDTLLRARQPLIENFENALKSNSSWHRLAERLQSRPDEVDRFEQGKRMLPTFTAEDLRAMAARYLDPAQGVELVALPRPAESAASADSAG